MLARLASFCERIETLNGDKHLLLRSEERELKRTVNSIIVHLSLKSATRLNKIVVVTETDRKTRAFDESLGSYGFGPDFSSHLVGNSGELQLWGANVWSKKVLVCRAEIFFRMCSADYWLKSSGTDPAKLLVVYLDVTLNTFALLQEDYATGWAEAGRLTSVLAACGRIERESHEQLLGWRFVQANMESADEGAGRQAGCLLFKSVPTRGPNNKEFDYCKPEILDRALDETVEVIKMAGSMIRSGGIVVIGSKKDLVIRLTERLEASRAHQALGIEVEHVYCPQRQDAADPDRRGVASILLDFDRVAGDAERKALMLISLRAVQHLDVIESAFKHAKLIFFVGLPFTHQRDWPFGLKLYATFDLMNSLLRELFEVCRVTPDCRALFIMDKHVAPDRIGMLASELHDIEFEDFYSMRSRLGEFLARYQHLLARPAINAI
jgi:hypothetical protein